MSVGADHELATTMPKPRNKSQHQGSSSDKPAQTKQQKARTMQLIATIALSIIFVVTLGFALLKYQGGDHRSAILWGLAAWTAAGVGVAALMLSSVENAPIRDDPARRALEESAAQAATQLRPYVGVSYVKATMEIGKPISILIRFTNSGKTPAEDTEILMRFQKVPTGTPINRDFTGNDFDRRSVGSVNVGNTVESEIIGHEWTMDELMQIATDGTHQIFAHGLIRYRSEHIPSGSEETPFCYEFDRESGQMVICRVSRDQAPAANDNASATKTSADIAETALGIALRSRLAVDGATFYTEHLQENGRIVIELIVRNSGPIPAKVVRSNFSNDIGNAADLPVPPVYDGSRTSDAQPLTIHSGSTQKKTENLTFRIEERRTALLDGTKALLVWGFYEYRDELLRPEDAAHVTRWAFSFNVKTGEYANIGRDGYTDAD